MSKVVFEDGVIDVEFVAASNSVVVQAETALANGSTVRVRLVLYAIEAKRLRDELARALVDADLSGSEVPL